MDSVSKNYCETRGLAQISEQQIELRKAARKLQDASDYLTENVQLFTIYQKAP